MVAVVAPSEIDLPQVDKFEERRCVSSITFGPVDITSAGGRR